MKIGMNEKQVAWNAINLAKWQLANGDSDSVHLANFYLRDLDATREADLRDLSYAIHYDGSVHKNDVLGLIEHLETFLLKEEKVK